ncbi:MAG: ATP-binding protein [Lentimicrobiaceae bacterium]|nr:ATP-binding protein [Lentimicrobiaceae bacterium]
MIEEISKYNFWNGNIPELGFLRAEYTNKIHSSLGNNLVKVLVGQRRAGKSFVLRQLAKQLLDSGVPAQNILYINTEYLEFSGLKTVSDLQSLYQEYRDKLQPDGRIYLFLDEIQQVKDWERFVNSHSQDFVESKEIFISGSNSDLLSGELASLLSGRYVEFEILPYSFKEYVDMQNLEANRENYIHFLQMGMLPELFHLQTEEVRNHYVSAIKDTVMLRDIVHRYKVKDSLLLDELFRYIVNNAGRMFSVSNVVNYFKSLGRKTNYETLSSYISYLCKAFLIHRAERYNIAGKELISGNCKYYSNDLAYYNYLYRGFSYGFGNLLENAIYLDLRRQGWQVYVGVQGHLEVDFVAIRGDRKLYVQVCWQMSGDENTAMREYAPLLNIKDQYRKVIISLDEVRFPNNDGVEHLFPWEIDKI